VNENIVRGIDIVLHFLRVLVVQLKPTMRSEQVPVADQNANSRGSVQLNSISSDKGRNQCGSAHADVHAAFLGETHHRHEGQQQQQQQTLLHSSREPLARRGGRNASRARQFISRAGSPVHFVIVPAECGFDSIPRTSTRDQRVWSVR